MLAKHLGALGLNHRAEKKKREKLVGGTIDTIQNETEKKKKQQQNRESHSCETVSN